MRRAVVRQGRGFEGRRTRIGQGHGGADAGTVEDFAKSGPARIGERATDYGRLGPQSAKSLADHRDGVFGRSIARVMEPATAESVPRFNPRSVPQLIFVKFVFVDQRHVKDEGQAKKSRLGGDNTTHSLPRSAQNLEAGLSQ